MESKARKISGDLALWVICIMISAILLALFLHLQANGSKTLDLGTKWLVVAAAPLIVAILRSRLIQKFKGFGIELETRLQDPIGRISLSVTDASKHLAGDEKQSLAYLNSLTHQQRLGIHRLSFVEGRTHYYVPQVILEYLHRLPALEFVEIQTEEGAFVALIPIETFWLGDSVSQERVDELVRAIKNRNAKAVFGNKAITEVVNEKEDLIQVLPRVRDSQRGLLPVVSSKGRLLGTVTTASVEKKIADAVIAAQEKPSTR